MLRSLLRTLPPAGLLALLALPAPAHAIPLFARRYKVSCSTCHNPAPSLNDFGQNFAANGYRMASGETPRDTVDTGDPTLALMKELPLAVRLDFYAQGYAKGRASTDFQGPTAIKLYSSGALSGSISYYFYMMPLDGGEPGIVEDAFIYFNDIGGKALDLAVGQFQVSDPIFKRELRLEFDDYAVYRARVGQVPVNLTYDRGIMTQATVAGFTLSGEVVNGTGIDGTGPGGRFDLDANKGAFLHVTRDVAAPLRLGGFGYYVRTDGNGTRNTTRMLGGDGTLSAGAVEVNGQYVYREDNRPTFTPGEPKVVLKGGFAEVLIRPAGSRFYGFALYNRVTTDRPLLDVDLGGPTDVRRHESIAAGVGHLVRRNVRVSTELGYDVKQDAGRLTLGLFAAF